MIPEVKAAFNSWGRSSLALALLFAWILIYPMHGILLQGVFGSNAYLLGHIFSASEGLGLIASGFLPPGIIRSKACIKAAGFMIFVFTILWSVIPQNGLIEYLICVLLGFSSAFLVLAWASGFTGNKEPELTLGAAMALTNVLLGLTGFAYNILQNWFIFAAILIGLVPIVSALQITRTIPPEEDRSMPKEKKTAGTGFHIFLGVVSLSAVAYFSGGFWYRAVVPVFYSNWPDLIGIDSFIYASAVFGLALYARKKPFYRIGIISLSSLGMGMAISIIDFEISVALVLSLTFFAAGLGAMDLFYWLTLNKFSAFLGSRKSFGFGLGLSLFFITAPGIAMDTGVLNPLLSPIPSVIGACVLFLISPFLLFLLHPLSTSAPTGDEGLTLTHEPTAAKKTDSLMEPPQPAFWHSLTSSEKKVYELIRKGRTDIEISANLYISRHTVKFHVRNILRKAGAPNRKELLAQLVNNRDQK